MGVENNESIIAITGDDKIIQDIKDWITTNLADEERSLFVFVPSIVNEKTTIFMAPDGSKKGWKTAEHYADIRDELIEFFKTFEYDDGSSPIEWVEVGWGEYGQKVLRGNNTNCYSETEYYAV